MPLGEPVGTASARLRVERAVGVDPVEVRCIDREIVMVARDRSRERGCNGCVGGAGGIRCVPRGRRAEDPRSDERADDAGGEGEAPIAHAGRLGQPAASGTSPKLGTAARSQVVTAPRIRRDAIA